jgi:rRNA pseudouridine-1189 N-methylase Emg1 (Nep1/Mra1 family)
MCCTDVRPSSYCLQVIKNPIEDHLPTGCMKIGTSLSGDLVDVRELVPENAPIVLVIGAMSHGSVRTFYLYLFLAIGTSRWPLRLSRASTLKPCKIMKCCDRSRFKCNNQ